MRFILLLLGLAMVVLAGLWFFTPVLDATYARHAPGLAQSRVASAPTAATRGPGSTPGAERSAGSAPSSSSTSATQITSKALAENVMSMINLGAGILGAWFTYMSYRLQSRGGDRRRD